MFIISRFIRVVRSQLNALLGWAEDPSKIVEQTILDVEEAYRAAKNETAYAVAEQKKMEKAFADEQAAAELWSKHAVLAVNKGEDDLAREALLRKHGHAEQAARIEKELTLYRAHVEQLRKALPELESKIMECRRRKNLLIAKQRRAEAQDRIYGTLESIQGIGALGTIQKMEEKVDGMLAVADARVELSQSEEQKLETRFLELDHADVETELLELKRQRQIEYVPAEPAFSSLDVSREKSPLAVESA